LLSLRPQPLGQEILSLAQAIFQVLTVLMIKMTMVIIIIVVYGVVTVTSILIILSVFHINFMLFRQGILAEGDICPSQRRASSEGLGLLARLGNDIFTARMVSFKFPVQETISSSYYCSCFVDVKM
jgi:hypothetical protein